jgi:Arc/MetJ-type ribon-helix-helix transcriptional regulator
MSMSPETQKLLDDVLASGKFKTHDEALAEALRLLKEHQDAGNGVELPFDEWREKFRAHLESTPRTTATSVNDSRESIYEGRGE